MTLLGLLESTIVGCLKWHLKVSSRLSAVQKKELLEGYRSGKTAASLAKVYGCSPNTVSRTVKALLSIEEYNALKQARSKGKGSNDDNHFVKAEVLDLSRGSQADDSFSKNDNKLSTELDNEISTFALTNDSKEQEISDSQGQQLAGTDLPEDSNSTEDDFIEVVPLIGDFDLSDKKDIPCKPFSDQMFPETVFLLVDRSVELDSRCLSEFPELGFLNDEEKNRKAICLFSNQRSAKRHCGRNQRVIKIPDAKILNISLPFLLAKGITRFILDGALISLDEV